MTNQPFPPAEERLLRFLGSTREVEISPESLTRLRGDASTRQYFRYSGSGAETLILTAYPEPFDPDRFSYRQVYDLLRSLRIPVPRIIQLDGELGVVEQEDLGDQTLQILFGNCDRQEWGFWLRRAIDFIVQLQVEAAQYLDWRADYSRLAFDSEKLTWELQYFFRYFLCEYQSLEISSEALLFQEFQRLARELESYPRVICHRDYHFRNLMVKGKRLYVIDFQDARWGPASYDLVSLLQDSISLTGQERQELVNYFLSKRPELRAENFWRQFNLMTVQRLLKALGTFGYQISVRQNCQYERYIQGSLLRLREALHQVPGLTTLLSVVEQSLRRLQGAVPSE